MERAGLAPMSVLRSATGVSAETLNFAEPIGRIAAGCNARLIFTRHDPLSGISNLAREKMILFDGNAVRCPDELDVVGL
jgi:imidazolonepropionase-like amidohydrolase